MCFVTVDGTEFRIMEPIPFNKDCFSHKLKGRGLRYEIVVSIRKRHIVSINGPFPTGAYPDRRIFNEGIKLQLEEYEMIIGDGGYKGDKVKTLTGNHNSFDCMCSVARARHKAINHRFKEFHCLKNIYRHSTQEHYKFFAPCALLVQLVLEKDGGSFNTGYIEEEEEI